MPVVTCPKCPTKMKVPDGVSGNTKCPKCGTVFPVGGPAAPAFEVVDEAPAPKPAAPAPAPKPAGSESRPVMKTVAEKKAEEEGDVEVVDDDDDDLPKKKKKRVDDDDDDDDDDEPRSKKKKKKNKKKRYDDDDDDDDWQPKSGGGKKRKAFAHGKTAAKLLSIAFWLNLGAYGLLALYILVAWIMLLAGSSSTPRMGRGMDFDDGWSFLDIIAMLPGLAGLGGWIVAIVGCGFAIAGPAKARGMAITAVVFCGLHLLLIGITFDNFQDRLGAGRLMPGVGKMAWVTVASALPAINALIPGLISDSRIITSSSYLIWLFAAVCEVLRLAFTLSALKATAEAAGDGYAADKAQHSAIRVYITVGGMPLVVLLLGILAGLIKGVVGGSLLFLTMMGMYAAYALMMLGAASAAQDTRDACDRRT